MGFDSASTVIEQSIALDVKANLELRRYNQRCYCFTTYHPNCFAQEVMRILHVARKNRFHRLTDWWIICLVSFCIAPNHANASDFFDKLKTILPTKEVKLGGTPKRLQLLATSIAREHIPVEHDDTRKWGSTKKVLNGWHVRADGLRIYTKRKWKSVNHGTWKRYRITQIDPDENIVVRIQEIREIDDGRVAFRIELASRVNAYARLQKWKRGIRLASVSVDADADILLTADCVLGSRLDPTHLPPDIVLQPEITDADLTLRRFEVNRISKFGGDIAEELGRGLRKIIEKKIEEKRPKIIMKINAKIAKSEDELRFSMHDFFADKFTTDDSEG